MLRSAGVFFARRQRRAVSLVLARPLVGSLWTVRQGPLARKTPTLLLGRQRIAESCSEFAGRTVIVRFTGRGFSDVRVVEFRELSQVFLLFAISGILK